jgi:hypothetical protein
MPNRSVSGQVLRFQNDDAWSIPSRHTHHEQKKECVQGKKQMWSERWEIQQLIINSGVLSIQSYPPLIQKRSCFNARNRRRVSSELNEEEPIFLKDERPRGSGASIVKRIRMGMQHLRDAIVSYERAT